MLKRLISPRSIAVVGASPRNPVATRMLDNIRLAGFAGETYAVYPGRQSGPGVSAVAHLRDCLDPPDAVLAAVGREHVPDVITEAVEVGAGGVIVVADGFAEADEQGRELQRRWETVARAGELPVLGPNCQGIINTHEPCYLYSAQLNRQLEPGRVGFISQSGGLVNALLNNSVGVRFSYAFSSGNEAVLDSAALLSYLIDDERTDVILAFLEAIRSPERFFAECDRARTLGKPIFVVKSGRSEAGREAALAHSGALAQPDRQIDALFARHGVERVDSLEALLECARLADAEPLGGRIGFVTMSGGQKGLLLDMLEDTALEAPPFGRETAEQLAQHLPSWTDLTNPLDVWGIAEFERNYPNCLRQIALDPSIDCVVALVEATAAYPTDDPDFARIVGRAASAAQRESGKRVVVLTTLSGNVDLALAGALEAEGVALMSGFPEALAALDAHANLARRSGHEGQPLPGIGPEAATPRLDDPVSGEPALELLRSFGVQTVDSRRVSGEHELEAAADRLGFPLVVKTGDAAVLHKTEAGGVRVGLHDLQAARRAFRELSEAGLANRGVIVQPQLAGDVEVIVGVQATPGLGSFVLLGLGGIWTEVFEDVALRPLPLHVGDVDAMLTELRCREIFQGARGATPDVGALRDLVEAVGRLAAAFGPRLESLDVNPVIVSSAGAWAVDAVVIPRSAPAEEPPAGQSGQLAEAPSH